MVSIKLTKQRGYDFWKGFSDKLSNNEYYPVLNLDDSSVKRIILGKVAGDTSIKLNLYVSEYEDF